MDLTGLGGELRAGDGGVEVVVETAVMRKKKIKNQDHHRFQLHSGFVGKEEGSKK